MFLGLILPIKIPVRELTPAGIIITHGGGYATWCIRGLDSRTCRWGC